MTTASESAVRTYRYLRLALVGLALLLGVSVAIEIGASDGAVLDSISAYFYTPVRGIFVGVLLATGVALVVVKGRDHLGEDVLLNLARLLAPIVAVVPTPVVPTVDDPCPPGVPSPCVPARFVPAVDNNLTALLVLAAIGLVVTIVLLAVEGRATGVNRLGAIGAVALVAVVAGSFALAHDTFVRNAHNVAAIGMFGLLVAVATVNAVSTRRRTAPRRIWMRRSLSYRVLYAAIALAMLAVVGVAVVLGVSRLVDDVAAPAPWLLPVEVALLVLFSAFWLVQTCEFWSDGLAGDDVLSEG